MNAIRGLLVMVALLAGSAAHAGWMAVGIPIIELDDVLRAGGSIAGVARVDGKDHPCTLAVRLKQDGFVYDYTLELTVPRPGNPDKPLAKFEAFILARSSIRYEEGQLTVDVRDYPEKLKQLWTFTLSPDGRIVRLAVKREGGFLGMGAREVSCQFTR